MFVDVIKKSSGHLRQTSVVESSEGFEGKETGGSDPFDPSPLNPSEAKRHCHMRDRLGYFASTCRSPSW